MQFIVTDEHEASIKGLLEEMGLPYNSANRQFLLTFAIGYGISQIAFGFGAIQAMAEQFPDLKIRETDTPVQVIIPFECPSCGVQVLRQPNGKITCNCKVWK